MFFDPDKKPYQLIWGLAWPQTLMMFSHFLIGFIDVYVAGLIDDKVQASLGIITQALFFFLIVAMALANGAVSAISQSLGAGKRQRALRYILLCLFLGGSAGISLFIISYWTRDLLLELMQVPKDIRYITDYFLQLYLVLLPIYSLFIVSNAVFRAQRQVYIPLFSMIIVTTVNTLGDFGLCFGLWQLPHLGYKGLPWATFFSVTGGLVFNFYFLIKRKWFSLSHFPKFRWIKRALPYLWQVSWPAGMMQVLWHSAYLILYAITASLPRGQITALAALAAGLRVESILFLPAIAFNMTASILVGYYLGKGEVINAKKIGFKTWLSGCILISMLGCLIWLISPDLANILSQKDQVSAEILNYLKFNIAAIPFTGTGLILGGVFIGAGATRYNMFSIGGTVWLIRLPLAFLIGHIILGKATGIWAAMFISQFAQAILMFLLFQYADWPKFSMRIQNIRKKQATI